jgi:hypothetical protein
MGLGICVHVWARVFVTSFGLAALAACGGAVVDSPGGGAGIGETGGAGGAAESDIGARAPLMGGAGGGVGGSSGSVAGATGSGSTPSCVAAIPVVDMTTGFETCRNGWFKHRAAVHKCPPSMPSEPIADGGTEGCVTDEECPLGNICECGATVNRCVPATCKADADCGPGLLCASYSRHLECGAVGYACQTPRDTCRGDIQCPSGPCDPDHGCLDQLECTLLDGHRSCQPVECRH